MKIILPLILALALVGCTTDQPLVKPEQTIVKQTEYIVRVPPAETMSLPPKPAVLNVDDPKLKQSDVAEWIAATEKYANSLQDKLIEVAKFLKEEQDKLDAQATTENKPK